jgi:hypothetical protein
MSPLATRTSREGVAVLGEVTRIEVAVRDLAAAAQGWATLLGVSGDRAPGRVRFPTVGLRAIDLLRTPGPEGGAAIEILAGAERAPRAYELNGVRVSIVAESDAEAEAPERVASARPYVIDIGARELAAAARVWSELLGRDAMPMHPEMDVSGALAGCHFATGGVYSLGLMALRDPSRRIPAPHEDPNAIGAWLLQRQLETRGEGVACIGFQSAPGVAETMRRLRACGVRFLHERPQRYLVGENCYVDPATTNDCAVIFAQHDAAAYARWQASLPEALRERH